MTEVVSLLVSTKKFSADTKDNSYFDFKVEANILRVDFYDVSYLEDGEFESKLKISKEFDFTIFFEPYKSFEIYFTEVFTKLSEPYNKPITRDGLYMYKDYYRLENTEEPAFIIYFHETIGQHLIICNSKPVKTECVDKEYIGKRTSEIILDNFPEYGIHLRGRDARRKMLMAVDLNDSLSGLEAQVDILTKIVIAFMEEFPDEFSKIKKENFFLNRFIEANSKTSLLNIKTAEKCIEEMSKQKTLIRNTQKKYYEEK